MPNVLVFESDSAFAGELKGELEKRGCAVTVVDDASVGLQTASTEKPDLILLTIELPRMNGFSVCNKLKRDPALKEVPLIIMSSDSTEETFEQHRRLRTHAEDYVHKPIAFSDLLPRISAHLKLAEGGAPASSGEDDIVIDDDIDFEDEAAVESSTATGEAPAGKVDADIEAFAESAFGSLEQPKHEPPAAAPTPATSDTEDAVDLEAESLPPSKGPEPVPEPAAVPVPPVTPDGASAKAAASIPPRRRMESIDQSLKEEVAKQADKIRELEKELRDARSENSELEDQAKRAASKDSEVQRLQRELDDAKAKAASGAKGGGLAREFLDLREALNKKDKELLDLRDQLSHKDKELLGLKDTNLATEREKADLSDRIIELEKQTTDLGRQLDGAKADKDQAAKRAEDFKRKHEKVQNELDAKTTEFVEAKRKHEEESATRDASEAAAAAAHQEALERAEEIKTVTVAAAEERAAKETRAEVEAERDKALGEAAERSTKEREQAIVAREAELKKEHDSKLAALHRANEDAMSRLKAEHVQVLSDAGKAAAARLSEQETKFAQEHEAVVKEHEAAHEATRRELAETSGNLSKVREEKEESEVSRDARIAALESDLEQAGTKAQSLEKKLEEREATLAGAEANLAATGQELSEARSALATERSKSEKARGKWSDDKASLERAKDALAAALAQIDEVEARGLE